VTTRSCARAAIAAFAWAGLACGSAVTAPSVTITSPADGDKVSGQVPLMATMAASTASIAGVDFVVDGTVVGTATGAPYSVSWNSSVFVGKRVTVTATARTTSGAFSISKPILVTVASAAAPLVLGKESMYPLVNGGVLQRADELLQDIWDIGPRAPPVYLKPPIDWTVDPYMDKYWRLIFYSLRPTTNLLWAYYTTGNVTYRDKLLEILASYAAYDKIRGDGGVDVSYDAGGIVEDDAGYQTFDEDYTTSFRAMILTNSYCKLKASGDLPAQLDQDLLDSVLKIGNKLSSPGGYTGSFGNHGFTSAASLVLLAANFPSLNQPGSPAPISEEWERVGTNELTGLIANAVDSDGVELENSPFYHYYVMQFAEEITSWADRWKVHLPSEFVKQSDAMSTYAATSFNRI
jgi:hypothetical protein